MVMDPYPYPTWNGQVQGLLLLLGAADFSSHLLLLEAAGSSSHLQWREGSESSAHPAGRTDWSGVHGPFVLGGSVPVQDPCGPHASVHLPFDYLCLSL